LCRKGFASSISPTIFETLSEPEVSDITNLREVRQLIDRKVITHGNLDLTLLRDGKPSDLILKVTEILENVQGFPHLIGASDSCLWPGTPPENIKAIMNMFN
jgi:uroporphyrinogen-III decarboxylase